MNYKKFFSLAKEKGILESDIISNNSKSISVSLFNGEIDSYNVSNPFSVSARGIVNSKFGSAATNVYDKDIYEYLVNEILEKGSLIEKEDDAIIFKGSKKYSRYKVFNENLCKTPLNDKINVLYLIHEYVKNYDPRIENIEISYSEDETNEIMQNSYGLKLSTHSNYYVYSLFVTVREDEEVVNDYSTYIDNDLSSFDYKTFAEKVVKGAVSKLHSSSIKSKKYKTVLNPKVMDKFIRVLTSAMSGEEIQKHTSRLENKLNEQIACKKVTILEKPLAKSVYFVGYDDEGVATKNKILVKNGVLKMYLHNLTTAKKAGVESTGNGYGGRASIGVGVKNISLKPGKKSFDEIVNKINNGIYVTEVMGLHAGLNANSGDFSLQAQGYLIEHGKISKPLSQIVIAGNAFDLFNQIKEIGSDVETLLNGDEIPSVYVSSLSVSGE